MPNLIRLPAEVPDGEMRVFWDSTDEGTCLHVWGPARLRRWFMSLVTEPRLKVRSDVGMARSFELRDRYLEEAPSVVDALEAEGFDTASFVMSIRRPGMGIPPVDLPDDVRTRLEEAQVALGRLREALGEHAEAKGVYLFDEDEKGRIDEAMDDAASAVALALDLASGDAMPAKADDARPDDEA